MAFNQRLLSAKVNSSLAHIYSSGSCSDLFSFTRGIFQFLQNWFFPKQKRYSSGSTEPVSAVSCTPETRRRIFHDIGQINAHILTCVPFATCVRFFSTRDAAERAPRRDVAIASKSSPGLVCQNTVVYS